MAGLARVTDTLTVLHGRALSYNAGVFIAGVSAVLVDPGMFADEVDRVRAHVHARDAEPHHVIITHFHWDHVLGPEYFPGVPVVAHSEALAVQQEHGRRIEHQVTEWERTNGVQRELPFLLAEPDETFGDELELGVGNDALRLIHAPGHAPEQLVAWHEASRTLWAADMLSDIEIPFVMQSLTVYRRTLDRLVELQPAVLIPGHGSATTDPREVVRRFERDRAYLAKLEERVGAAIRAGRSAVETVRECQGLSPLPDNEWPHQQNVLTAFAELGGVVDPAHPGWNRFE